jgi:hypothetical protein
MHRRLRGTRRWTIGIAVAAGLAAVSSAAAGPVILAVHPTQLILVGLAKGEYTVRNPSGKSVSLTASIGNYAIKPNGKAVVNPKVPPKGSAKSWLTISPTSFTLKPHTSATLAVQSHPGEHAGPGDHHALILFTTAPTGKGRVLVRTRIGVTALVRVPGKITRKLVIGRPSAVRRKHQLRFPLLNQGNIDERLLARRVSVALKHGQRLVQTLRAPARDILPHSRTVFGLPYRHALKGKLTAIVTVRPLNGQAAGALAPPLKAFKKTFTVRF